MDIPSKEEGTPASVSDPFEPRDSGNSSNIPEPGPEPEPSGSTPFRGDDEAREIPAEEESTAIFVPEVQPTKEAVEGDFDEHAPAETIVENVQEVHLDESELGPSSELVLSETHDESLPEIEISDSLEERSVEFEENKETQPVHAFTEPGSELLVDDVSRIETEEKIVDSPPTELEPTTNGLNPEEGDVHASTNESEPASELNPIEETLNEVKGEQITEAPTAEISNEIEASENIDSEPSVPAPHAHLHNDPLDADEVIPEPRDLNIEQESDSLESKDVHTEESPAADNTSEPKELSIQPADDDPAAAEPRDLDSALEYSGHGLEYATSLADEGVTSGLDHSNANEPTNTKSEQMNHQPTVEEDEALIPEPRDLDAQPEASAAHDPLPEEDSNIDKDQDLSSSSSEATEAEHVTRSQPDNNDHPQIEETTSDKSEELGVLEKLVEQSEVESGETILHEPQDKLLDGADVLGDESSGVADDLSAEVESDKNLDDFMDHSIMSEKDSSQDVSVKSTEETSIETDTTSVEASEHLDHEVKVLDPEVSDGHPNELSDQHEHEEGTPSILGDSSEAVHELEVEHESPEVLEISHDIETLATEIPDSIPTESESCAKDLTNNPDENEMSTTNDGPVHEEPAPLENHEDHLSETPSMLQTEVAKDTISNSGDGAEVEKLLPEDTSNSLDIADHSISSETVDVVPDTIHEEKLSTRLEETFPEDISKAEASEFQDAEHDEINARELSTVEEDLTPPDLTPGDVSNILEHYQSAEDNPRDISTDDEFESALSDGGSTSEKHEDVIEEEHSHEHEVSGISEVHDTAHALAQDHSEPIETSEIETPKESSIEHIHDAETITENLSSVDPVTTDEHPANIEEQRVVEEHSKPEVISEEKHIKDNLATEEVHTDENEPHIGQQLNHEPEHLQEPVAPGHTSVEETTPLEIPEREIMSEAKDVGSKDIGHHEVTHSEPPQDDKEAESEPINHDESIHKESVLDDDENPSQIVDRELDLPVLESSPEDVAEPMSAPSYFEHSEKENEHPESAAHLSESPIVPVIENQGSPTVETPVSKSEDDVVLGHNSDNSNEGTIEPKVEHSSELESKDENDDTGIPAHDLETEEHSMKADLPHAVVERDISPEVHGVLADEKVDVLENKEVSSDFQEYQESEGVSLMTSEEELTPRALPLDSEIEDLSDLNIDDRHPTAAQTNVFDFLDFEDSESPEVTDDTMDEGSLKDGAPLNGSTGPEDDSLEDETGTLTPNQHHVVAESVLNTDDLFGDDTDSDSSDRSEEESDADGEEDEDDGEEDEETYDSDGSDSEEEEEDSDAPIPVLAPIKIERSFPHVIQNMPSYEFGKPKMVDPFSEQSNEQVDFSSSHRSSGLFASLVDTIKSDLPVVKKMANDGGPRSPRGENDYATSETKEPTPVKAVVPNAFQQTDTEEDAAFYDSFSDHQPSSSHVRSQTAETVPSFVSYAQSDADSTASETPSSPFQDNPREEPRIASSVALEHVLEEPRDLEQEASPLRAEFDPYGSNTYPKYITPKQSQANLKSPVKSPRSSRNDRFVSQSIVSPKTQYGPRGTPSPRSRRFSVSTTAVEGRPIITRTMTTREKRSSQDSLPSPTLKRTMTDQNISSTVSGNRPISSPSPPSNSFFQKTRSLFESSSGQVTQTSQTITRPLSGYFNGRGSPSPKPKPQLQKKGSMASLRSQPSSLYQGNPGAPLSEEDLIVPRNLDGDGKPPSPAYTIPTRRDSLSSQRERKSSHGSMNRVENDINVFTPSKGIRPRGNSSLTGLGKLVGGERGLDDSVHNPERERVPLLAGEGDDGGVGVRDRS